MNCSEAKRLLGRFVDHELSERPSAQLERHLAQCHCCRTELDALRRLAGRLAASPAVEVPPTLWESVARRLGESSAGRAEPTADRPLPDREPGRGNPTRRPLLTRPWALAAALALAVGLGIFSLGRSASRVDASPLDFSVLLDALPLDAQLAFRKFLVRYDAKPTTPMGAHQYAPALNFATPQTLPGGFELQTVYRLRLGAHPGIAAAYQRDGEFLAAIFHPPVCRGHDGAGHAFPCVVGKRCGQKVVVGEWKFVHLTDPTTCHCVLSRLDEAAELPAVLAAVAPKMNPPAGNGSAAHPAAP